MIKVTVKGVEMSINELAELYDELEEFFGSITVKEAEEEEVEDEEVATAQPASKEAEEEDWP
jgi:Ran GTPase-activating protein (RanGAP) involved in mRNA processing and transport